MWTQLDDDEKAMWKGWEKWDALRFERDAAYFKKYKKSDHQRRSDLVEASGHAEKANQDGFRKTSQSSFQLKGKRALEESNAQVEKTIDVNVSSFHVPKRKKNAA